jgi:hypothetical protein
MGVNSRGLVESGKMATEAAAICGAMPCCDDDDLKFGKAETMQHFLQQKPSQHFVTLENDAHWHTRDHVSGGH